jgi:hypothetical protein
MLGTQEYLGSLRGTARLFAFRTSCSGSRRESTLRKSIAAGAGPRTVAFGRRRIVLAGDARDWLAALREKVESAAA